jgi:hypothetical protein
MAKGMDLRARNGLQGANLALLLLCCPAISFAAPPEIYLGYDARYSDNIEKSHIQQQSDLENRFSLRGNYQTDPGKCVASVDGEIAYSIYTEDTYDPETQINAGALGRCELARGLSWEVENQIREVTRSSRLNDTPDNRVRKNVFRTGPDYLWRLTARDSIALSTRYENTELSDETDADSERVTGSVAWNHAFSPDLSAGLSASFSDVELDTGAEIYTRTVSTTFSKRWATTTFSGSLGLSEIETELGSVSQKSDGVVGDLSLTRVLDSSATVFVRASRELTDQTSDFDIRFEEFTFELRDSNTLEVTTIETGLNKSFSNADRLSLTAYASRSDYLDSIEQEDQGGLRAGYTRQIMPLLSAVGNARYEYLSYESDQSDDQVIGMDVGLAYQASRSTELAARIGRNERTSDNKAQEYEENWVLLSIDYRFR